MKNISLIIFITSACYITACKKYLDAKPNKRLVIPSQVSDLQGLLDDNTRMNNNNPNLGEASSDNYYLTPASWLSLKNFERNTYVWDTAILTFFPNDWSRTYDAIYFSNVCLEQIEKMERNASNAGAWDNVKGSALLFRAKSFLEAVWTWSKAYDNATSSTDLGLPLRLNSDFNEISVRSSVKDTYDRIIEDLRASVNLLPITPVHVMRPSKKAAYALLARTFLSMRQYDNCLKYSDSCLQLYSQLQIFDSLSTTAPFPFSRFNKEVIMHSRTPNSRVILSDSYAKIDSVLYNSYSNDDLRKAVFFKTNSDGTYSFKGSYDQSATLFNGICTDEVYLMRAESYARTGNKDAAIKDLNDLLRTRWKRIAGVTTYVDQIAVDANDALNKILIERRKELLMRDLRWIDIKRLNKEGANISLKRFVDNQTYILSPNDNKYALPLPSDVIILSRMQQNPR